MARKKFDRVLDPSRQNRFSCRVGLSPQEFRHPAPSLGSREERVLPLHLATERRARADDLVTSLERIGVLLMSASRGKPENNCSH
jgi:hypothetical protein